MTTPAAQEPPRRLAPTERRWLPVVIVAILLVVVAGGTRSVADATATDAGPVTMGAVRVQPPEGWQVEGSVMPASVRLHKGPVVLDIVVGQPVAGGPLLLATLYREQRLAAFEHVLPGAAEQFELTSGLPAARFPYLAGTADGVLVDGLVVAVVRNHVGLVRFLHLELDIQGVIVA